MTDEEFALKRGLALVSGMLVGGLAGIFLAEVATWYIAILVILAVTTAGYCETRNSYFKAVNRR